MMKDPNVCSECGYPAEFQEVVDQADGLKEYHRCECGAFFFYCPYVDSDGYDDDWSGIM